MMSSVVSETPVNSVLQHSLIMSMSLFGKWHPPPGPHSLRQRESRLDLRREHRKGYRTLENPSSLHAIS